MPSINKVILFTFKAPLHLANAREAYDSSQKRLHADKLYSAIMETWALLGQQAWLDRIKMPESELGQVDFQLSSLFPFTRSTADDRLLWFLPRLFKPFARNELLRTHSKAIRGVTWLDSDYFFEQASEPSGTTIGQATHIQGEYLCAHPIDPDFMASRLQARVKIPRGGPEGSELGNDAEPYYTERLYFKQKPVSGLYGFFSSDDPSAWERVKLALKVLAQEGLGTDRNVGNGQFDWMADDLDMFPDLHRLFEIDGNALTNLALYNPNHSQELSILLNGNLGRYQLIKRGGWITSDQFQTLKKNSLYMFAEGGLWHRPPNTDLNILGAIRNLRPELPPGMPSIPHPIWRVGKGFFITLNLPAS